jgi:Tfp pilus assembly protein PilO
MKLNLAYWRRLQVQYGVYVLPVAVITAVVLLTIGIGIPKIKASLELRQELKLASAKLARLTEKAAALQRLDELELAKRVAVMERVLPSRKDVGGVLVGLRQAAAKSGVNLLSLNLAPGELATGSGGKLKQVAGAMEVEVKLTGTIAAVAEWLRLVEAEGVPVMRVKAVSGGQDAGSWQLKVSLTAEYLPLPESLGAADKPLPGLTPEEEAVYVRLVSRVGIITATGEGEDLPLGNPNLLQ